MAESKTSWELEPLVKGSQSARVFSPSNIALAKYWGKRDLELNLPTNGSVSVTLKGYGSFTTAEFDPSFSKDRLILNGKEEDATKLSKVLTVVDELRGLASSKMRVRVQSYNNFPTAAGLASSASGLSAVTAAAVQALRLDLPKEKLSEIARKGSGSACRSFFSGFVEWKRGERSDGTDSVGHEIAAPSHWPLKILIAVANRSEKNHASTGGMEHTRKTSPYFESWVECAQKQLTDVRAAIHAKDFKSLAELAESNCIRMHASAMAAFPPVFYWQPATVEIMQRIWALRAEGVNAFFTIDAGPNVVVLCEPDASHRVIEELAKSSWINVLKTEVGEGTRPYNQQEWQGE